MSARARGGWLILALFVAALPAVTTRIYASDEVQYFAYLALALVRPGRVVRERVPGVLRPRRRG